MHESITMAVVGSIEKVSGSRIATPFGPPRPGSTPTKMPRMRPTIMNASVFHVIRTVKPCRSRPKASIASSYYMTEHDLFRKPVPTFRDHALAAEGRFQRPLRHDHIERDVEGDEHDDRKQKCREQRFPGRNTPDEPHEARDQQKARHIEAEPLHEHTEQQCRDEHLHDAGKLFPVDESPARPPRHENLVREPIKTGGTEQ